MRHSADDRPYTRRSHGDYRRLYDDHGSDPVTLLHRLLPRSHAPRGAMGVNERARQWCGSTTPRRPRCARRRARRPPVRRQELGSLSTRRHRDGGRAGWRSTTGLLNSLAKRLKGSSPVGSAIGSPPGAAKGPGSVLAHRSGTPRTDVVTVRQVRQSSQNGLMSLIGRNAPRRSTTVRTCRTPSCSPPPRRRPSWGSPGGLSPATSNRVYSAPR